MILVTLLFFVSLLCLLVSLLILGLVVNHLYPSKENFNQTTSDDAILISGCDSGIGLQLAKYFFKTSKLKIICGFLKPNESNGYEELSQEESDRLILINLDITSKKDVEVSVDKIDQLLNEGVFKNIIAVINNAGTMTYGEFDWLTWDQIQTQIDVNFTGTVRLTKAMMPYIIESKGRFINVSSVNDQTVFPGLSIYSGTKSALSTFSRGLGYELRKFGVNVVTVRLGDFARLTNIMAGHSSHIDDMWNEMSAKKKGIYKDFFHEFNSHLMKNYGMTSPKEFSESSLFYDFRKAVLAKNPPYVITCAPWTFKIFYFMIELMPIWIQFYLLDFLIQFGFRWKPPQVNSETTGLKSQILTCNNEQQK